MDEGRWMMEDRGRKGKKSEVRGRSATLTADKEVGGEGHEGEKVRRLEGEKVRGRKTEDMDDRFDRKRAEGRRWGLRG